MPPPARPAELGVLSGRQRLGLGLLAAVGQATVAEIRATIRASPRVYADETGLREDEVNG